MRVLHAPPVERNVEPLTLAAGVLLELSCCISRSRRGIADARRLARANTCIRQVNAADPDLRGLDADRPERRLDEDGGGVPTHAASVVTATEGFDEVVAGYYGVHPHPTGRDQS